MVLSHEYKIFILGQKSDHFLTIILRLVLVFVLEETVIFEQLLHNCISIQWLFGGFSLPYTFDKQIIIQADHKRPWRSPANNDLT